MLGGLFAGFKRGKCYGQRFLPVKAKPGNLVLLSSLSSLIIARPEIEVYAGFV
jgi:hypothetical protein